MDMVYVHLCMHLQLHISVRLCVMAATEKSRRCDGAGQSKFETHCSALVCYTSVQKLIPQQRGCQQYPILFIKHQERAYTVCLKARENCSRLLRILGKACVGVAADKEGAGKEGTQQLLSEYRPTLPTALHSWAPIPSTATTQVEVSASKTSSF